MAAFLLLAALVAGPLAAETIGNPGSPFYTADSIANTAANTAGPYAPNTFLTIYGDNLAFITRAISPDEIADGFLPTVLLGAGVRVLINLTPASIYFVSPKQVNFLVPASLAPGPVKLQLVRDGVAGPSVDITLRASAPALFQTDAKALVATHADGSLIRDASPARPGEVVVLYASGLGPTSPAVSVNRLAQSAAQLAEVKDFRVWLNGVPVDTKSVLYAGVTPGFAGLFQVNVRLPEDAPTDPEIRIGVPDQMSPAGRILLLRRGP